MASSLSTKTAVQAKLHKLESEINTEAFEAFYHVGQKLLLIKKDRLYEAEGFKNWGAYCASGRIDYRTCHADRLIRSSELRQKIGTIVPIGGDWTHTQILELCKCTTDNDAKRVAKTAIKRAEKTGERLTAKLIASVRDQDKGDDVRKLKEASLDSHLEKLSSILVKWFTSLEMIADEQWEEVDAEVLAQVRNASNVLNKFLRS